MHRSRSSLVLISELAKVDPLDPSDLQPPLFPKKDKNSPNTLTIPARSTLTRRERIYQKLWKLQARVRENDIKYAIKVGLGTGKSNSEKRAWLTVVVSHVVRSRLYRILPRDVSRIPR